MMIRSLCLFAIAAALSGCASMDTAKSDSMARVQNAVYRVADDATSATSATEKMPPESKPVRIFWFLGGR
jgi:hypothetical protein